MYLTNPISFRSLCTEHKDGEDIADSWRKLFDPYNTSHQPYLVQDKEEVQSCFESSLHLMGWAFGNCPLAVKLHHWLPSEHEHDQNVSQNIQPPLLLKFQHHKAVFSENSSQILFHEALCGSLNFCCIIGRNVWVQKLSTACEKQIIHMHHKHVPSTFCKTRLNWTLLEIYAACHTISEEPALCLCSKYNELSSVQIHSNHMSVITFVICKFSLSCRCSNCCLFFRSAAGR